MLLSKSTHKYVYAAWHLRKNKNVKLNMIEYILQLCYEKRICTHANECDSLIYNKFSM